MYVCDSHFTRNDYILPDVQCKRKSLKKCAVPSRNLPVRLHDKTNHEEQGKHSRLSRALRRKKMEDNVNNCPEKCTLTEDGESSDVHTTSDLDIAQALIEFSNASTHFQDPEERRILVDKAVQVTGSAFRHRNKFTVLDLIKNNQELNTMTGIPSIPVLLALVESCKEEEPEKNKMTASITERIVCTMMRLKLDLSFRALAVLFQWSPTTSQNFFQCTIKVLAHILNAIICWPSKEEVLANMPKCFTKFKQTRIVLDGTEMAIEKNKCLNCRIFTYSHYKGMNTIKFMVGVTPSGLITFVSKAYGGRASDKAMFNQCGILEKLEPYVDAVMVDKGYMIEKECLEHNIQLIRPPFASKKKQMPAQDALRTADIAAARVHVERANQRIKQFKVFTGKIPWSLLSTVDDIMTVICGLVNLTAPLLADDKY